MLKSVRTMLVVASTALMLTAGAAMAEPVFNGDPPLFKSVNFGGKTISGTFNHVGTDYTVSLKLDVIDYRNGTSHKVYVKPEDYQVNKGSWTGQLQCPVIAGPGVKVVSAGSAPVLSCNWKFGNGVQPPENSGTVTLQ